MKWHNLVGMDGIPKLQNDTLGQWCTPHLKAMLTTNTQTIGLSQKLQIKHCWEVYHALAVCHQ